MTFDDLHFSDGRSNLCRLLCVYRRIFLTQNLPRCAIFFAVTRKSPHVALRRSDMYLPAIARMHCFHARFSEKSQGGQNVSAREALLIILRSSLVMTFRPDFQQIRHALAKLSPTQLIRLWWMFFKRQTITDRHFLTLPPVDRKRTKKNLKKDFAHNFSKNFEPTEYTIKRRKSTVRAFFYGCISEVYAVRREKMYCTELNRVAAVKGCVLTPRRNNEKRMR